MSVTAEQQQDFVKTYLSLADNCAKQLNIDNSIVLGQWALESAWGTEFYVKSSRNLAGIMRGSAVASFATWTDFEVAYIQSMHNDCPNLRKGVHQTQAAVIFDGTSYNTVNSQYAKLIQELADEIKTMISTPAPLTTPAKVTSKEYTMSLATSGMKIISAVVENETILIKYTHE